MKNGFNETLFSTAIDSPELQEAILASMKERGYSIPTRRVSNITEELEDLTVLVMEIEDPEKRERAVGNLKEALDMTVRDLAIRLNIISIGLRLKEAKGEELTPEEKTLKDLDITALAYTLRNIAPPKESYQSYDSKEAFEEARERMISK